MLLWNICFHDYETNLNFSFQNEIANIIIYEIVAMEKQREEQVNKLQENMDTLRDERDAMESKLNDIIVHTKDDNVQQERIDNFDSN